MRKAVVVLALLVTTLVNLKADVTLTQTMTMEGPAAAMMQAGQLPKVVMRIKGLKARSDIEMMGQTITAISDLAARQVIMLQSQAKTAQVISAASVAAGGASLPMPDMDVSLKPTGKSQTIEGQACDEHAFTMTLDMASMLGGAQVPPEAAAALQDVRMVMNGSVWLAKSGPGAAEYAAFSKAAVETNLLATIMGMKPGQSNGIDKLMAATAAAQGVPYLTEIAMTFEGSGPMVEAMGQMGPMKMIQKISSVSTEPISDDLFKVPDGYKIDQK